MAELRPLSLPILATRMLRELREHGSVFDLPKKSFFLGDAAHDFSVSMHGHRVASPLGPAAGPHTQMAQNLVLSWLAGCRILELKTVQIRDELTIPRPCIDMATIGYNVEWSQELRLTESLTEYVKAAMLIEMLKAEKSLGVRDDYRATHFDMSVGYDLAGIKTDGVLSFIGGLREPQALIDAQRATLPMELRDLPFPTELSGTLTLSTFHGCPPREIEQIIDFLLGELRLDCIVKLNPLLLGPDETRRIIRDELGYGDVRIPDSAFERDTTWQQAVDFVGRLRAKASALGLGFGIKLTNTLIVENHRDFFPDTESEMYLSGPPLHVLAMRLVQRFRQTFDADLPISFSAGIDRHNFADAAALGLVPITVCTDLLKQGGYGRARHYFTELTRRMDAVGARDLSAFVLSAYDHAAASLDSLAVQAGQPSRERCLGALAEGRLGELPGELRERWLSAARAMNTDTYLEQLAKDERYGQAANAKPPRKVGSQLVLFDCLTCDKCVPVCPNDANFTFVLPRERHETRVLRPTSTGFIAEPGEELSIEMKHQLGTFADFCNECGNCDVFCPEDGGPYAVKPLFFGCEADFETFAHRDGFYFGRSGATTLMLGRFRGAITRAILTGETGGTQQVELIGDGYHVHFDPTDPGPTASGDATLPIDLTPFLIMDLLRKGLLEAAPLSYPALLTDAAGIDDDARRTLTDPT